MRATVLEQAFGLGGQHAIVTGASAGGLGEHIARVLAGAGARVALLDLADRMQALADVHASLPDVEGGHLVRSCDVSSEASVDHVFGEVAAEFGSVELLVNAAGVMIRKPTIEMTLPEWQRVIDVNLTGTWLTNRAAARAMLAGGYGRIVNVSSIYTNIVGPLPEAPYYASKGGVAQVTRGLAGEWGAAGINVNCVAPGVFFPTRMTEPLRDQADVLQRMEGRTFLQRLGDPARDIGAVVLFLCAPAASYVTGQVLFVDGGWSAW